MSAVTPSTSEYAVDGASVNEQIQRIVADLPQVNAHLENASPVEILKWSIDHLPNLYQTTAFGLTGCVTLDLISKISAERSKNESSVPHHLVPLIFVDTLYHFPQTLDLANRASSHYNAPMHVYRPIGTDTVLEFERRWGPEFWVREEDTYDYLVKVEPARVHMKNLMYVRCSLDVAARREQTELLCKRLKWMKQGSSRLTRC